MLLIEDKKNCCGCTACYTICPKSAIQMTEDQEGFLYPRISTDQCINCGLCEKICPIINRSIESDNNETMQIGIQNKDLKQRMESTAGGGIFPDCRVCNRQSWICLWSWLGKCIGSS